MKKITHHVFLSPHLNDAVFSCGGYISKLIEIGDSVKVITIFAGIPDIIEKSSSLTSNDTSELDRDGEIVNKRRKEDRLALASLGVDAIHLDFLDCIYRKDGKSQAYCVLKPEDILSDLDAHDLTLVEKITDCYLFLALPALT